MTMNRCVAIKCTSLLVPIVMLSSYVPAQSSKYACGEPNPATLCNPSNTCGSASAPCSVDVKRTANAASSTPSIANGKNGSLFCVKVGTTVQWKSTGRNIGFVVDLGPTSPLLRMVPLWVALTVLYRWWPKRRDVTSIPRAPACPGLSMGCADRRVPS